MRSNITHFNPGLRMPANYVVPGVSEKDRRIAALERRVAELTTDQRAAVVATNFMTDDIRELRQAVRELASFVGVDLQLR